MTKDYGQKFYKLRIQELTNILNKILSRFFERFKEKELLLKTQNYMLTLNFQEVLIQIFDLHYQAKNHEIIFQKTILFFEYFTFQNRKTQQAMVPHLHRLLDLVGKKQRVGRVINNLLD